MSTYFTIATSGLTTEHEKLLADLWKPYPWWHWIPNFWLMKDPAGLLTATILRDQIKKVAPTAAVMVVQVEPTTWAGAFGEGPQREWLRTNFPPETTIP